MPHHRRVEVVYVEESARPFSLTLNPLPLVVGRLSGNLEFLVAPHHAIVVSPNLLLFHADRGGPGALISEALGFATPNSNGFGLEVGYHYFWLWDHSARGPFCGPSLLVGATNNASVGDPTATQAYWGFAFDLGEQVVLVGGFTIGAGAGLGFVRMDGVGAVFPRLLLQVGWSF